MTLYFNWTTTPARTLFIWELWNFIFFIVLYLYLYLYLHLYYIGSNCVFVRNCQQAIQLDEKKRYIYEPCIPYFSVKHNMPIEKWSVIGLLFGARESLPKFTYTTLQHLGFNFSGIQWVYCTTWPAVARAGEDHVTFTAFPLSFPCDAHIPHLSSLVRQSDLCSRPVHTWIKLRSV